MGFGIKERVLRWANLDSRARPRFRAGGASLVVPFGFPLPEPRPERRAVMMHIFFPELAPELTSACRTIPGEVDLLITTDTSEKADSIRDAFASWTAGKVDLRIVENRGRDMLPKFVTFVDQYKSYSLILFLHSKRSDHLNSGNNGWRETLIGNLAGSEEITRSILTLFDADPQLGIVYGEHFQGIRQWLYWGRNRWKAGRFSRRIGLRLGRASALDYPSGSMFWARPQALKPILEAGLTSKDFEADEGQIDGTLAHVLERMPLFSAEVAGYSWVKVADADRFTDQSNFIRAVDLRSVPEIMRKASGKLLP